MNTVRAGRQTVRELAERLGRDVRSRRLRAGDRYLSTSQVSQMLGVSTATAHRVLKVLADSQLLERRQNQGTFVGPQGGVRQETAIRTVYVLVDWPWVGDPFRWDIVISQLHETMDRVNVQLSFLPRRDGLEYVQRLMGAAGAAGDVAGVLVMSAEREIYRFLADADLPTVIMGSVWKGDPPLTHVDCDYRAGGRLLIRRLVDHGHQCIAFFPLALARPGTNSLFEGVTEELSALRLPPDALLIRHVPADGDLNVFDAEVRDVLSIPNGPRAIVVAEKKWADRVVAVASELGMKVPGDVDVVFHRYPLDDIDVENCPYMRFQMKMPREELGALFGKLMKEESEHVRAKPVEVLIPMELIEPNTL